MPRTLASLAVGEQAAVVAVRGRGAVAVRLLEMGFVAGSQVSVIKVAPFGDPVELCLRGYHVSLRASEAECVDVEAS